MSRSNKKDFEVVYKRKYRRPIYQIGLRYKTYLDNGDVKSIEDINDDSKVDDSQEKKS